MRSFRASVRISAVYFSVIVSLLTSHAVSQVGAATSGVMESGRNLPLAWDVDVVVVGGSCGAVAAAVAAHESGAKVFLATPRAYLGSDLAGMLRLWLTPDEVPTSTLAKRLFVQQCAPLPFSYTCDRPSQGVHKDSGTMLCDGKADDVQRQTVEFADDVTVHTTFKAVTAVKKVEVIAFARKGDFDLSAATITVSRDGREWSPPTALTLSASGRGPDVRSLTAPLRQEFVEAKITLKRRPGYKRILVSEIFFTAPGSDTEVVVPTPLHVKQSLDDALMHAKIPFLTGSYVTDILRDAQGMPSGIVMANRSGRQAVRAKVIIDATERATAARLAGATATQWRVGTHTFERVVIAAEKPTGEGVSVTQLPGDYTTTIPNSGNPHAQKYGTVAARAWLCKLALNMPDNSWRSFAAAEQAARDRTFVKTMLEAADSLFQVPPDHLTTIPPRFHILGGCANISRTEAAQLLRPLSLMDAGSKMGREAAAMAQGLPTPTIDGRITAVAPTARVDTTLEVRENLTGLSAAGTPKSIEIGAAALPVLGTYDVVVVGGGTGGAPAGIGAARQGAKTLLIEYLHGLGGVGTLGMIGKYWYGNICGFTAEHDRGVARLESAVHVVGKAEWWRRENRRNSGEVWFGVLGVGTINSGHQVRGVVVATPQGRGVVLAKSVVDATGNSDIAATAGATTLFTGPEEFAMQGSGLSQRKLGASYINSDFGYVSDSNAADLWLFGVRARAGAVGGWDISQVAETRERQRIIGDVWVTPLDIVNERTFPDTIVQSRSDFDSHGYSIADITYISEPIKTKGRHLVCRANVPYRAMLPKGIDNLLVTGIGISAHRDAMPVMRMQPDVQNMGYAAGVAAAAAARSGGSPRDIDVKALQKHLVEIGTIPAEVLTWQDNAIVSPERLTLAVRNLGNNYRDVSIVLAQAREVLPALRQAYLQESRLAAKQVYAHVLGILGDATGAETLIDVVSGKERVATLRAEDEKAFGRRMSDFDSMIVALGRTRDKRALNPLLAELQKLDAKQPVARFRSLTLALEALGHPAAAQPLAELLRKRGVGGHALTDATKITPQEGFGGGINSAERYGIIRELAVARALLACGDYEGLGGKTMQDYAHDVRGIYATHAAQVLQAFNERKK